MSKIQISLLQKINQLMSKNSLLESELTKLESELKTQAEAYQNEEQNFAIITKEKQVLKLLLGIQAENLAKNRALENKIKLEIGQIIDSSISDYLTEKNTNDLVAKIIAKNPGKKYTIEADPELAKKLDIKDFKPADKGQLRVSFEFSSFILDPENLYNALRPRLLTKILN